VVMRKDCLNETRTRIMYSSSLRPAFL